MRYVRKSAINMETFKNFTFFVVYSSSEHMLY